MRRMLSVGVVLLGLAGAAGAQGHCPDCPMHMGPRGGGWMNGPYARMYDPQTVETVQGEVAAVERLPPMRGMSEGVHLIVKTDKGNLSVHLGPAWYLDQQETQLAPGDRVQVRGSRVVLNDKPAIIAAEVHKGRETLRLRDDNGVPVWRGWR